MANWIVITFDNVEDAPRMRETIKDLERQGLVKVEDAAVIIKDADGKIKTQGQASRASVTGAVVGGALGLLITWMFPLAGIAVGAAGGALVGHSMDKHVDKKFVQDVEAALQPNSSAIFLLGEGDPTAVSAALRPYKGTLYHTSVGPELEQALREALE